MGATVPLSLQERQRIYEGWVQGRSVAQIASELQRSAMTVRKWWRRIRRGGLAGLSSPRRGRPRGGVLVSFAPEVKRRVDELWKRAGL